jgi:lysophospholipase L1-like esterase
MMKRREALLALGAVAAMPLSATAVADPPVQGLGYTMRRLTKDKALTVGYFGGSITEGAGASKGSVTSWRAKTTAYLKATYPDAKITEANAAIGGTGSDLGAFRLENDLLVKKPDLVFVEFAVNDGNGSPRTIRAMEGIVRQIKHANPLTDIVFIYTVNKGIGEAYNKGELPGSVQKHGQVARHYGIPEVNVGEVLWKKVQADYSGDFTKVAPDTTHPNDEGYGIYAATVQSFLEAHKGDTEPATPSPLPAPLTPNPLEKGRLLDTWTLPEAAGWTKEEKTLAGRYPHLLAASAPGSELTIPFTGDVVGLYWLIAPDSGDIEWSLDGGPAKRLSSWDKYALKFTRAGSTLLADNLPPGPHTLKVRVLAEKNAESTGTAIRIGAILLNGTA